MTTILVADDNAPLRRVICHLLFRQGFDTLEARDGQEAIDVLEADHVEAVLLDAMMPRLNGFEACRIIAHRWKDVPVILCTARDRRSDVLRASQAGAVDYLLKPFTGEELAARVRKVLVAVPTA